jgi:hypothetical protein
MNEPRSLRTNRITDLLDAGCVILMPLLLRTAAIAHPAALSGFPAGQDVSGSASVVQVRGSEDRQLSIPQRLPSRFVHGVRVALPPTTRPASWTAGGRESVVTARP